MYRLVLAAFLTILTARAQSPQLGQLDASPTLFTVMAAIQAAGFDADLASPSNVPLRMQVRQEIAKKNIPSLVALREFVAKHRQRNDTLELSQYISYALTTSGPPDFAIHLRGVDVPPDVVPLTDIGPLLAAFYREADIEDLWKRSQRAIDQYLAIYHEPVLNTVLAANAYLRQQTSGFQGRRFQIFVELLAPPNQVQFRSYGNVETVVVTPSAEPRIFDIRHAYLHYLLDPLATRNAEILNRKKGLADHAQRAGALGEAYKDDFLQLTTASLIKAVEARLDHKPEMIAQALREGFILAPYFAEQLPAYEKQESSMLVYYKEMVQSIDVVKEDARLAKVEFNKVPTPGRVIKNAEPPPPPPSAAARALEDAERLYKARDLVQAKARYLEVLKLTDEKPKHAAAYYGLARIAVLQKDPETGQQLFQKTLGLEPDPFIKGWTLVYLGRLSAAAQDGREQALKYFQAAAKLEGASTEAVKAAEQAIKDISK